MASSRSKSPKALAVAKLASSGITLAQAERLGIKVLTAAQTAKLFPATRRGEIRAPALKLVYHDLAGRERRDVYRVRLLAGVPGKFGTTNTELRYLQPPDTPPAVYLPRVIDWAAVAEDAGRPITITEGELKAACAAVRGLACFGLGGVWSWRSKRLGFSFLPELERFTWVGRVVTIAYDSDLSTNPSVGAAVGALVHELRRRGALCRVAYMPDVEGLEKTGLDDYAVLMGDEELREVLESATDDALTLSLWEFNARFCLVENPGCVYDEEHTGNGFVHKIDKFAKIFSNRRAAKPRGKDLVEVSVAAEWLQWDLRRTAQAFTFQPDGEAYPRSDRGHLLVNAWTGWGCESVKGDVRPWHQLLDLLFEGAQRSHRDWFERWCLYPVAHPGAKCHSCVGIWSADTGQGKSKVGETLGRIYGDGYRLISQKELEDSFNEWQAHRQLVMVDDVSAYDSRSKADILKKQITAPTVPINTKGITKYFIPDLSHFYLTSNRANAFYIEPTDRRYFIHEVTAMKLTRDFYVRYHEWLNGAGPAALRYYAEHELDFGDFDPTAEPPVTRAKTEMIDVSRTELELWLTELREDPDAGLRVGPVPLERDLVTARELLLLFEEKRTGRSVPVNALAATAKQYFPLVNANGGRLTTEAGVERFYVVRDTKKWLKATDAACVRHVEAARAKAAGRRGKY